MKRLLAVTTLAILLVAQSDVCCAQWVQTDGPYGGEIMAFSNLGSYVFVSTYGGGVFRSSDSGVTWDAMNTGLESVNAREVGTLATMGTKVIACTTTGGVFLSTDSGVSWNALDTSGVGTWGLAGFASHDSLLYASGGNGSGIYYSPDSGSTWLPTFFTTDNGKTWLSTSDYDFGSKMFVDSVLIGNGLGGLLYWGDGSHFKLIDTEFVWPGVRVLALVDSQTFIADSASYVYRSTNLGRTWIRADSGLPPYELFTAVAVLGTRIIAATAWDGLFGSDDTGLSWHPLDSGVIPSNGSLTAVEVIGNTILCNGNEVFRSTDFGETWVSSNEGLSATHVNTFLSTDSNLFAGTWSDLYHTTDFGTTWVNCSPPILPGYARYTSPGFPALVQMDSNVFAAENIGLFRSTDQGSSWIFDSLVPGVQCLAVFGDNLIAGSGEKIFHSTDLGTTWDSLMQGESFLCFAVSGTNLYTAIDPNGWTDIIYRSSDSGATWEPAGWPLGMVGGYANYDLVGSLASIGSNLFAGTGTHGVYQSSDEGASWWPSNSGLSDLDITALLTDSTNLFVGTDTAGVFLSVDSGRSWHSVSDGLLYLDISSLAINTGYLFAGINGNGVSWRRPLAEMTAPRSGVQTKTTSPPQIQSYPNPFTQSTTITFSSQDEGYADVTVVNLLGEQVARIFSGELAAGEHSFSWDASGMAPGMYECIVRVNGNVQRVSMICSR